MRRNLGPRFALPLSAALFGAAMLASTAVATHGGTHVTLQPDTKGCKGVLPSTDGNTDMRVVGGTMEPGGTAVFEITYPLDASSVGKDFTITAGSGPASPDLRNDLSSPLSSRARRSSPRRRG